MSDIIETKPPTRSNPHIKIFEHIPPRVDPDVFQAEVPQLLKGKPRTSESSPTDWYLGTYRVHSPENSKNSALEFLVFARNLTSHTTGLNGYWNETSCEIPLESDELILEYLNSQGYDLERAKFNLMCSLSPGKELIFTSREMEMLENRSIIVMFQEMKDQLLKNKNPMLGSYSSSSESRRRDYDLPLTSANLFSRGLFPLGVLEIHTTSGTDNNGPAWEADMLTGDAIKSIFSNIEEDEESDFNVEGYKRGKFDKNESKRKSKSLYLRVVNILNATSPSLNEALQVLDEAVSDTFSGTENIFSEDMNIALGELLKNVMQTRLWIAKMHDTIHELHHNTKQTKMKTDDSFIPQNHSISIDDALKVLEPLRELLLAASNNPLRCGEETQLRRIIKEMEKWIRETHLFLSASDNNTATTYFAKFASICGPNSHSLLDSPGYSEPTSSKQSSTGGSAAKTPKLDLKILSDWLWMSKRIPVPLPEFPRLEALYRRTLKIVDDVDAFLDVVVAVRARRSKANLRKPFHVIKDLFDTVTSFPVQIPRANELKDVVEEGEQWQRHVMEAKGTMPLKRVESLIAEGDKLPFEYPLERELLQDRRQQAREWLDKLKKSFQKGIIRTRKTVAAGGEATASVEKPELSQIKEMICVGEQLYDHQDNKDLSKALGVLDAAEDWLERVKDTLAMTRDEISSTNQSTAAEEDGKDGYENPSVVLQALLREADNMPVKMEEAALIRAHLRAFDWAQRLRPLFASKEHKLQEFHFFRKEMQEIRSSLLAAADSDFKLPTLPEEEELKDIIQKAEQWQERLKKITVAAGTLRKGVSLEKVRKLIVDGEALVVGVSTELKYLRDVVENAETWLLKYMDQLRMLEITCSSIADPFHDGPIATESTVDQLSTTAKLNSRPNKDVVVVDSSIVVVGHDNGVSVPEKDMHPENIHEPFQGNHMVLESDAVTELAVTSLVQDTVHSNKEFSVTFQALNDIVVSSADLLVEIPEVRQLNALLQDANQWLQDVETSCPRRVGVGKRKIGHSTIVTTNNEDKKRPLKEFLSLYQRGLAFKLDFSEELHRIQEVVQVVHNWDSKSLAIISHSSIKYEEFYSSFKSLFTDKTLAMPYFVGFGSTIQVVKSRAILITSGPHTFKYDAELELADDCDNIDIEEDLWDEFTKASEPILEQLSQYENTVFGASPKELANIAIICGCIRWIKKVESILYQKDWGDINRALLSSLLEDVHTLIPVNRRMELLSTLEHTKISSGFLEMVHSKVPPVPETEMLTIVSTVAKTGLEEVQEAHVPDDLNTLFADGQHEVQELFQPHQAVENRHSEVTSMDVIVSHEANNGDEVEEKPTIINHRATSLQPNEYDDSKGGAMEVLLVGSEGDKEITAIIDSLDQEEQSSSHDQNPPTDTFIESSDGKDEESRQSQVSIEQGESVHRESENSSRTPAEDSGNSLVIEGLQNDRDAVSVTESVDCTPADPFLVDSSIQDDKGYPKKRQLKKSPVVDLGPRKTRERQVVNWQQRLNELSGVERDVKRQKVSTTEPKKVEDTLEKFKSIVSKIISPEAPPKPKKTPKMSLPPIVDKDDTTEVLVESSSGDSKRVRKPSSKVIEDIVANQGLTALTPSKVAKLPSKDTKRDSVGESKKRSRGKMEADTEPKKVESANKASQPEVKSKKMRSKAVAKDIKEEEEGGVTESVETTVSVAPAPTGIIIQAFIGLGLDPPTGITIPVYLEEIMMFLYRLLEIFQVRLEEAQEWGQRVKKVIQAATSTTQKNLKQYESEVLWLLHWATVKKIRVKQRKELEMCLIQTEDWRNQAKTLDTSKLILEDLKDVMRKGERLIFYCQELELLANIYNLGKSWVSKLEKIRSYRDLNPNYVNELRDHAASSREIPIDLSSHLLDVDQQLRVYCICRQHFNGEMIGCDECDDWYHFSCVGFSKLQADRMSKYSCIRCTISKTFQSTCHDIANAYLRWTKSFPEYALGREKELRVILRKKVKEEENIAKLIEELNCEKELYTTKMNTLTLKQTRAPLLIGGGILQPQAAENSVVYQLPSSQNNSYETTSQSTFSTADSKSTLKEMNEITTLSARIETMENQLVGEQQKIEKTRREEENLHFISSLEFTRRTYILEWMALIRRILWPRTQEQIDSSKPVPFGLPKAFETALAEADAAGIMLVPDVIIIRDALYKLGWLYRLLLATRGPVTTGRWRRLVTEYKALGIAEDRLMRLANSIVTRSTTWKSKVRKLVTTSSNLFRNPSKVSPQQDLGKRIANQELEKAAILLAEADTIPVACRLKEYLKEYLKDLQTYSNSVGKRNFKATYSTACAQGQVADISVSSDEEDNHPEEGSGGAARAIEEVDEIPNAQNLAPLPQLWPANIDPEPSQQPVLNIIRVGNHSQEIVGAVRAFFVNNSSVNANATSSVVTASGTTFSVMKNSNRVNEPNAPI